MKQECPFDKMHVFKTKEQLHKHVERCKSPNKINFQQCKYDKTHWVNFTKIKQHEQQCNRNKMNDESKFSSDDSVLIGLVNELDYSKGSYGIQSQLQSMRKQLERSNDMMKKKKKKNKKIEDEPENNLWSQPSFGQWIKENYLSQNSRMYQQGESQFYDSSVTQNMLNFQKF